MITFGTFVGRRLARIFLFYWLLKYVWKILSRRYPGPLPWPLIGNMPEIVKEKNIYSALASLSKRWGNIFALELAGEEYVVLKDPKAVLRATRSTDRGWILSTEIPDVHAVSDEVKYKRLEVMGYNGLDLFLLWGEPWRRRRKLVQQCFDRQNVKKMLPVIEKLVHFYHKRSLDLYAKNGEVCNILRDVKRFTFDVIGETSFSTNFKSIENGGCAASSSLDYIQSVYLKRAFLPFQRVWRYLWFLPTERKLNKARDNIKDIVEKALEDKKVSDTTQTDSKDLLTVLLQAFDDKTGSKLSESEIRDDLRTLVLAGFDTTSVTISNVLYFLAKHPEYQEKLYKEIQNSNISDKPFETYSNLEYLSQCIKEAQRLTPVLPMMTRRLMEDIDASGYLIPKGQPVIIPVSELHRDPNIYKDPDNFNPSNFDKDIPKPYFMPFGQGPKMCVGYQLALVEAKCFLYHTVRRYTVHLHETTTFEIIDGIASGPKEVKLLFKRRGVTA